MTPMSATTGLRAAARLLAPLLLASCAQESAFVPQETPIDPEHEIQRGWALFRERDYRGAMVPFGGVAEQFPSAPGGHVGLGWCRVEIDSLEAALRDFRTAERLGGDADGHAGLAVTASALGLDSLAVAAAERVEDPAYQFTGDPEFGYTDLLYIRALGLFHLARYADCYATLRMIDPSLSIDLDAYDFREQLFLALQSLRGTV